MGLARSERSRPLARRDTRPPRWRRRLRAGLATAVALFTISSSSGIAGAQASYQRISGEGSGGAGEFIDAMRVDLQPEGITVDFNPSGSTAGRQNFLNGSVDFAVSDLPFQFVPEGGSPAENPAPGSYAYVPIAASGLAFAYNLKIDGQKVTQLRLSGENVTKLFTGAITRWNDPAIASDNPGLSLPDTPVRPVVRAEPSGATAHLTRWMSTQHTALWNDYCLQSGRAPACGETSRYPIVAGMVAQSGDIGVAGYVSQGFAEGAIGYVDVRYAAYTQLPVAKLLNEGGFYTAPATSNVALSLLKAQVVPDAGPAYLTQDLDAVYTDTDSRNYPLSFYRYLIVRTGPSGWFNADKGRTLAAFASYSICLGQQRASSLGHAPLPVNLVTSGLAQVALIPGADVSDLDLADCNNPTFFPDGRDLLARTVTFPPSCDALGPTQCGTAVGGPAALNQAVTVTRPNGALVLTQVCGAYGPLDAEGAQLGFPTGLPAETAVNTGFNPSTDGGLAPYLTQGDVPFSAVGTTAGPGSTPVAAGAQDPVFAGYPYPDNPVTGEATPTYPTWCGIELGAARFVRTGAPIYGQGQYYAADGRLNQVTVVDTRDQDQGWNIAASVTDFTAAGGKSFSANQLGWTPRVARDTEPFTDSLGNVYNQTTAAGPGVAQNTFLTGDGLGNPPANTLISAAGRSVGTPVVGDPNQVTSFTGGLGIAVADARIKLAIPVTALSGNYTAVMTITAL